MSEKMMEFIINSLPALIAGITCVLTMFKVMTGISSWKNSINETNLRQLAKDLKNVCKRNQQLIEQNQQYKNEMIAVKEDLRNALIKINALSDELKNEVTKPIEDEKVE